MASAENVSEQENPMKQLTILHWLLFAFLIAGLYVVVLMQLDASRAKALEFRYTSETQMFNLASNKGGMQKPSPFGRTLRSERRVKAGSKDSFRTVARALPAAAAKLAN